MASTLLGTTITLPPQALTLLRLTPLLSSTASLVHAYMERVTTTCFLTQAPTRSSLSQIMLKSNTPTTSSTNFQVLNEAKETVIPVWFVNFFDKAVWSVVGFNALTLLSASANLWLFPRGLKEQRVYYLTGLVAAVGHYVFVPFVSMSVERLYLLCARAEEGKRVEKGKSAVECVREWVGVHKVRMSTVDLVAWGSFVVGVVGALTG